MDFKEVTKLIQNMFILIFTIIIEVKNPKSKNSCRALEDP